MRLLAEQTEKNRLWIGSPRDKNKSGKEVETLPMATLPQAVLYSEAPGKARKRQRPTRTTTAELGQ